MSRFACNPLGKEFFVFCVGLILVSCGGEEKGVLQSERLPTEPLCLYKRPDDVVRIFIAGDVNFSWGLEKTLEEGRDPFFFVRGVMREADLALVNLETTVATNGSPQTKTHVFRSPPEVLHWLTNAGVDVVSLANNHAMDYGAEALLEMREHLRQYGIRFAGAGKNWEEAIQPVIVTQKGMTVGIVCAGFQKPEHLVATEKRPGTAGLRWKKIVPMVKKLRREVDYLIFFVHWGWEYVVSPLEKEQVSNAYAVIEAGADVIVGHHPHILQAIEVYRGRPILYSVGNFVFPQWNIAQARPALAVVLDVSKGKNGIEKRVYLLPLYRLSHTLQVVIASGQEVHEVWELVHQRSLERGKTWRLVPEKQSWVPFWRLESSTP